MHSEEGEITKFSAPQVRLLPAACPAGLEITLFRRMVVFVVRRMALLACCVGVIRHDKRDEDGF